MNLIIDTNVFLPLCAAKEEPSKICSKIIRDCDKVIFDDILIIEYVEVLKREGFSQLRVLITLAQFDIRDKLRHIAGEQIQRIGDDIITHEKDRHLVECACASEGIIITYEKKHLIDLRREIKTKLSVDILHPIEYLNFTSNTQKEIQTKYG